LRERDADFSKTSKRLAAAGGAEEKARLHAGIFTQRRKGAKTLFSFLKQRRRGCRPGTPRRLRRHARGRW
jgi:uncharacterized DUF497 family protein